MSNLISRDTTISKFGWVPVSEKFPKEEHPVILCTDSGYVCEGEYYGRHGKQKNDIWKIYNFDEPVLDEIVAWMPLPKPYQMEVEIIK